VRTGGLPSKYWIQSFHKEGPTGKEWRLYAAWASSVEQAGVQGRVGGAAEAATAGAGAAAAAGRRAGRLRQAGGTGTSVPTTAVRQTARVIGWIVLSLVFVNELLAVAAAAVWGEHVGGPLLAVLLPLVVIGFWATFASPKAPYGGPVLRPVVKVAVFTGVTLGLWSTGHGGWAVALFAYSVVVNAAAQLPSVRALTDQPTAR
jgi:uncharacterized protein DUF2568